MSIDKADSLPLFFLKIDYFVIILIRFFPIFFGAVTQPDEHIAHIGGDGLVFHRFLIIFDGLVEVVQLEKECALVVYASPSDSSAANAKSQASIALFHFDWKK